MALNMTTFAAALKQHYTDEKIENMVYKDNPFLAMDFRWVGLLLLLMQFLTNLLLS